MRFLCKILCVQLSNQISKQEQTNRLSLRGCDSNDAHLYSAANQQLTKPHRNTACISCVGKNSCQQHWMLLLHLMPYNPTTTQLYSSTTNQEFRFSTLNYKRTMAWKAPPGLIFSFLIVIHTANQRPFKTFIFTFQLGGVSFHLLKTDLCNEGSGL